MEILIGVRGEADRRKAAFFDIDAQFLIKLTYQRRLRRFAVGELTAGKLPQAFEMLALWPLGDQHPAIDIDQGDSRDQEDGLCHRLFKSLFSSLFRSGSRH